MNETDMALATAQLHEQNEALASIIVIVEKKDEPADTIGASVGCLLPPGFEYCDQLADTLEAIAGHVRFVGRMDALLA